MTVEVRQLPGKLPLDQILFRTPSKVSLAEDGRCFMNSVV